MAIDLRPAPSPSDSVHNSTITNSSGPNYYYLQLSRTGVQYTQLVNHKEGNRVCLTIVTEPPARPPPPALTTASGHKSLRNRLGLALPRWIEVLLLAVALASPALAQSVLTVDTFGNVVANGNVTTTSVVTESVVVAGTYTSGITASGAMNTTCQIAFTNGGGTGAVATVTLNPANTVPAQALTITAGGLGYRRPPSPPNAGTVSVGTATSCSVSTLVASTTLGGYVLNALTGPQPSTPASPHGLMWFDNASDWPLAVPMGLDSSGNASAMVRTAKGTAIGSYTPYYSSIGGLTPPTATLNVYNSTPSSVTIATGVSGALTATAGGPYTTTGAIGSNVITQYCVQVTASALFEWGTDPTCTTFTSTGNGLSTSPVSLSL